MAFKRSAVRSRYAPLICLLQIEIALLEVKFDVKRSGGCLEILIIAVLAAVVVFLYATAQQSSRRSRQRRQKILNRYRQEDNEEKPDE